MTLAGKFAALLPGFFFLSILSAAAWLFAEPSWISGAVLIFALYGFPLFIHRLHDLVFPVRETVTDISLPVYIPWWTSHQIQLIYIAIPLIEAPLHLVPGLFSLWLRLWGSRIGRGVYWTPKVEVLDRGLLQVEDGVVVGYLAGFSCHAISPVKGKMSLIIQKIHVGKGAFIGGECRLGPGSKVEPGQMLKAQTVMYWKGILN